jgi:pyruvate/2-oxoglutarate dehydrogenase complex dihydrolipoamide dehydrogenase (E3) component
MSTTFDAILVGAGQAAPSLAHRLAAAGMKIAFVERHLFGGTCVNTGCTPTKTWVASARAAHVVRRAEDFGFQALGAVAADMGRVKARKDAVVRDSSTGVERGLRELANCTVFQGTASFVSRGEMQVNGVRLKAAKIFLNVGARAAIPDIPGLRSTPYLTNTSILELDTLPEHLLILGGSYIALEFAQIFRRFGSQVTVLQRGERILTREDADVAEAIASFLEGEGIRLEVNVRPESIEHLDGRFSVRWGEKQVSGSHLLVATGRIPNTHDLGLEHAGITTDKDGYIPVNDRLESAVPGIWALGDCNRRGAFTHTSYNDFEIVAANILDGEDRKVSDRITAYNIYIDPPLGRAGLTETEVRKTGRPALKGVRPMTRVSRAVERGETLGFLKLLVDAETKLIVGASLVGIEADEVVHSVLDVMYARKPYTLLTHAVHIHPTVSELIPTVLGSLEPL